MLLAQCAVGDGHCQEDGGEGTEYHTQNHGEGEGADAVTTKEEEDRKSTRLNSSHS